MLTAFILIIQYNNTIPRNQTYSLVNGFVNLKICWKKNSI